MDAETKFLAGLIELQYGQKVEKKLRRLAQKVSWAKGWPQDKRSFWNAEAFMWGRKIEREKRKLIARELKFLRKGKNLDLGCGAYSYLPSVGFDFSEKMLLFNEQCQEKVRGDLEQKLPFKKEEFDSATAVFVLNYIRNYRQLLREIKRFLKPGAFLVVILSGNKVNDWQRQKEKSRFSAREWLNILEEAGFKVIFYEKDNLFFFKGRKR